MTCMASGDPTPSIEWVFEGSVVASSQGVLSFSPVSREDEGVYTCTATNAAGTDSTAVFLTVQCKDTALGCCRNIFWRKLSKLIIIICEGDSYS